MAFLKKNKNKKNQTKQPTNQPEYILTDEIINFSS